MADNIKLAENVVLIDVISLNETITNVKNFFEENLKRKLDDINLDFWMAYLALDSGIREGDNRIQVLLIYDDKVDKLEHCMAPDLKELGGMGCKNPFGEFVFSAISSEGFATRENLYLDLLQITLNSADVKRLILAPSNEEYGDKVHDLLQQSLADSEEKSKQIIRFYVEKPDQTVAYKCDTLLFSLMHAFGVRNEELGFIYQS